MGLREKFVDRIKKKEQEIDEFEAKIREARAYIQALQDSMRLLPRDLGSSNGIETPRFKPGSLTHKTYEFLKKTGRPMHIKDIIMGIGLVPDKKNRASLRGSLGPYTRDERIFRLVSTGTFGLVEFDYEKSEAEEKEHEVPEMSLDVQPF